MGLARINENNIFAVLNAGSWALLIILTLAGAAFGSLRFAGSVLAGGVLAIANYHWLHSIIKRALDMPAKGASRFAQVRYLLRLAIMGGIIYLFIVRFGADIFGLLLGLSVLVLNIAALSIYMMTLKGG